MGKTEKGTPKDIANRMKAKGLGRLRWYCQVCQKQMRDENGFKCHTMTEGHLRQMLVVGENLNKHIDEYSNEFKNDFITLLSRRWGTKRVSANHVYQEFISDKSHTHMNATQWVTLTEFVKWLGRNGICHVDETERGWFISWIDNSPKALAQQAANQKKERVEVDDEQREHRMIAKQIERAQKEKEALQQQGEKSNDSTKSPPPPPPQEPKNTGPIKLAVNLKKAENGNNNTKKEETVEQSTKPPAAATGGGIKLNPLKAPATKSNPLKGATSSSSKSNPLKSNSSTSSSNPLKREKPTSEVEAIMLEEMERKRRRENSFNRKQAV